MNAKSFFLLAAFVCAAFLPASFAQIGIKAGVNLASTSQNESDGDYSDYTNTVGLWMKHMPNRLYYFPFIASIHVS